MPTVTIRLAWDDNSADEDNFVLERKAGGGSFATLATLGSNVTTHTDSDVIQDVTYVYRVKATNTGGSSAYSNELTVRVAFAPVLAFQ